MNYRKTNVNVNVKFILYHFIYNRPVPDLGLYLKDQPVY